MDSVADHTTTSYSTESPSKTDLNRPHTLKRTKTKFLSSTKSTSEDYIGIESIDDDPFELKQLIPQLSLLLPDDNSESDSFTCSSFVESPRSQCSVISSIIDNETPPNSTVSDNLDGVGILLGNCGLYNKPSRDKSVENIADDHEYLKTLKPAVHL